ncbi:hypothetical protein CGZ75_03160 [Paenibacillus herberti]|uniref:Uncharacterized protein n=1 Tax=Paenibacillus herberti TaxID=1619309 RepID=A0A229P1F9_9BACL|nr:hypothetical protein CGZ75_03160 [Paenibacillus herberti]
MLMFFGIGARGQRRFKQDEAGFPSKDSPQFEIRLKQSIPMTGLYGSSKDIIELKKNPTKTI